MPTTVKFLSETGAFNVEPPGGSESVFELGSVVGIDGGTRLMTYEMLGQRTDPANDARLSHRFDIGSKIQVFEVLDSPRALIAFWRLPQGWLSTFIQDDVGCGSNLPTGIETIAEHIDVSTGPAGLPTVGLRGPLTRGDSREDDERDTITFIPGDGSAPQLRLQRLPTWSRAGESVERIGHNTRVTVRHSLGIAASCVVPENETNTARESARELAASITPA